MTSTLPVVDDPTRNYGDRIVAVEPGGTEFIPLDERHGRPIQLLWTWTSPNMEFATVGVGILGPLYFGLSFWQAFWAIVLGTALGSATHGVLSAWGPRHGLPQMVISRSAFGFFGNVLPGRHQRGRRRHRLVRGQQRQRRARSARAVSAMPEVAVPGDRRRAGAAARLLRPQPGAGLRAVRVPGALVIFVVASVWVLTKSHPGAAQQADPRRLADHVRRDVRLRLRLEPLRRRTTRATSRRTSNRAAVGLCAGLGVFWSCTLLEIAGAGVVTAGQSALDPSSFTNLLPTWIGKLTLLAVVLGAIAANALNVYSGSISFMALGFGCPAERPRGAIVAVVFGADRHGRRASRRSTTRRKYENFLLIIAYWIGPWLGVVFVDRFLRRGHGHPGDARRPQVPELAGPIAMFVAMVVSIWLFCNQAKYTGPVAKTTPASATSPSRSGFVIAACSTACCTRCCGRGRQR